MHISTIAVSRSAFGYLFGNPARCGLFRCETGLLKVVGRLSAAAIPALSGLLRSVGYAGCESGPPAVLLFKSK